MLYARRILPWLLVYVYVRAEIYTSSYQVSQLAAGERELVSTIQDYIDKEERRLKELKLFVQGVKQNLTKGIVRQNLGKIDDPISALQVIKRFETTWSRYFIKLRDQSVLRETLHKVKRIIPEFPDTSDVDGACKSIIRLQRAYRLDARQLQNISLAQTSPSDCFQLAETAFHHGYQEIASDWLNQALYLKHPHPNMAESRAEMVKKLIAAAASRYKKPVCEPVGVTESERHNSTRSATTCRHSSDILENEEEKFYKLCRGDTSQSSVTPGFCQYKISRLSYHRWKQEVVSRDPYIAIFHDVISDFEQRHIIDMSRGELERAGVGRPDQGVTDEARTSKVTWLWDNHTEIVHRVSRRVAEITDLCTEFRDRGSCAEPLQTLDLLYVNASKGSWAVLNYGVGGQYHSHYDFYPNRQLLKKTAPFVRDSGDRLATFMFYLSFGPAGGATVFPEIGVRIPPIKGSAAFWYNYKRGKGDPRTKHGGCPVLKGEKWVANKWIHEVAEVRCMKGDWG